MLKQRTKSLRDRTVVTAAILSLMGGNVYRRPARSGERAATTARPTAPSSTSSSSSAKTAPSTICSRPTAARRRACRQSSVQGNHQQGRLAGSELCQGDAVLDHSQQFLLDQPHAEDALQHHDQQAAGAGNVLRAADLLHHRRTSCPQRSGLPHHAVGGRSRRLRPAQAGSAVADDRRDRHTGEFAGYARPGLRQPAERPLSAGDAAAGRGRNLEPLQDLRRQPGASLLPDVAGTRLRRHQGHRSQSERLSGRSVPVRRDDRLLRQQRQSDAEAAQGRRHRDGLLQRRQGRRALSDQARPRIHAQRQLPSGGDGRHLRQPYDDRLCRRALLRRRSNGDPATPNHVLVPGSNPPVYVDEVENPNPAPGTNNWYTKTATAAAATPTAPTPRSRASPRSSPI